MGCLKAGRGLWALGVGLILAMASPVSAHHSASMFDRTKPKTLKGVVRDFAWTNPHASLTFVADPGTAEAGQIWVVELTSPGSLTRLGWTKRSLQGGDHVEVTLGPLRSGGPAGVMIRAKNLVTGATFAQGGPTYQEQQ